MSRWRKRLFLATDLIAAEPVDYLRLPRERTITVGAAIKF
jgi:KUP system potassium uptake protein